MAAHNSGFRCISSLFPSFSLFSPSQHSAIDWIFSLSFHRLSLAVYTTPHSTQHIRQTAEEFLFSAQRLRLQSLHENADRVSLLYIYTKRNLKVSVSFFSFFSPFLSLVWFGLVTNEWVLSRKKDRQCSPCRTNQPVSQPAEYVFKIIHRTYVWRLLLVKQLPKTNDVFASLFLWHLKGDLRHVAASFQYYRNERFENTMTVAAAQKMVKFSPQRRRRRKNPPISI